MLHTGHTYENHPLPSFVSGTEGRRTGVALRMPGIYTDATETRVREAGSTMLAGALDKPNSLREANILDRCGYCWVHDVPLTAD